MASIEARPRASLSLQVVKYCELKYSKFGRNNTENRELKHAYLSN